MRSLRDDEVGVLTSHPSSTVVSSAATRQVSIAGIRGNLNRLVTRVESLAYGAHVSVRRPRPLLPDFHRMLNSLFEVFG